MGHFGEMEWFSKVMSSDDSTERERLLNSFDASWITMKASEIISRT
jgi:hypothetical protein